jgi:hypothetical protein
VTRKAVAALGAMVFGSSLATSAAASDLSWSGPADCAHSEQLLFQVERALGAPLAVTGNVHLQVHVARTAPDARALLRIEDEAVDPALSERSLVAPDCEKLVDTLAVAITLALEAAARPQPAPPSPLPTLPSSIPSARPPAAMTSSSRPAEANDAAVSEPASLIRSGPIVRVVARLLGDVGSLPSPAFGVGLGGQLGWSRLQLELFGTLWSEQHTRVDVSGLPEAGADMRLVTGTLAVCSTPLGADPSPWVLALCLGWEMGRLSGLGTGISAPRHANGPWIAPEARVGLTWRPARNLGLGAQLGAATPFERGEFYLDRLGTVHQPASVLARAGLSVEIAFE